MKKKTVDLGALALFWFVAVLWSVKCIVELFRGTLQGLDPIIAAIWCLTAVKWTKRYFDERKEEIKDDI